MKKSLVNVIKKQGNIMLFDIIILIGIIAVIVGRHNSKGTTHELPNYTIVYVIGIPFLAIAVFSSFLTQYTPDFIKNVFCIWWWVQC